MLTRNGEKADAEIKEIKEKHDAELRQERARAALEQKEAREEATARAKYEFVEKLMREMNMTEQAARAFAGLPVEDEGTISGGLKGMRLG